MTEAPCKHRCEWWRPPTGAEVDEAERNGTYVSGALVCNACGDWAPLPGERRPLVMPADEFALVRRVAEQIGLDPAAPMTPAQHEAWHAAMAPDLPALTMTDEEAAEFAERFAVYMAENSLNHRVIPLLPPLSPDQIRSLLRECVTVVKPGEVLVIRAPGDWTPNQLREYAEHLEYYAGEMGIRAMVVAGDGLGVAEPAS